MFLFLKKIMRCPIKWSLTFLLLNLVLKANFIVAISSKEILNFGISCLKYNNLGNESFDFPSCLSENSRETFDQCIKEASNWFQNKEESYIAKITNLKENVIENHFFSNYMEILNSTVLFSTLTEIKEIYTNSGEKELICPFSCDGQLNKATADLEMKPDFLRIIGKEICKLDYFDVKICVRAVESNIERYLEQNKYQNLFERSTSLKICYNIAKYFGRNLIYLSHILDLIAFDLSIEEQLGISLTQILRADLFELQLDPKMIYIFDSIRLIKLKKIYYKDKNLLISERNNPDILDKNDEILYSFAECLMGSDLILKLYLIPMPKSINLCQLFFSYRGALLFNQEMYGVGNSEILGIFEIRNRMKVILNDFLKNLGFSEESFINLSRFNLFKCLDSFLNEKQQLNISTGPAICFRIFKEIKKDVTNLFDVNVGIYTSVLLKWLIYATRNNIIVINDPLEKEIYEELFEKSSIYSLLQAMSEGFSTTECRRHLGILNSYESFINNQNDFINYKFPFFRYISPKPIKREYLDIICNEKSVIFQILSQTSPLRGFLTIAQPTKISFKNKDNFEYSKIDLNLIGTKDIFDKTLQLYFAGDVPRGYLMNAVSFSLVGLKAFLRNTLTFLSQETIMNRYDEIKKGLTFITPFTDVLTIMGISGSYTNFLNAEEQIYYTNKYICSGSFENIEFRVANSNIIKHIGHPFALVMKEIKNHSDNMFDFINCVDQYILSNWKNGRYSILKSDPILFCSAIAIYLARDYDYIQEEIKKYAIYITYYELTGNPLPQKCIEVSFINIPFLKNIKDNQLLSDTFINCIENYSLIPDFLTKEEIIFLSKSFSSKVLEFVDKPMALHSSSTYRRVLLYVLSKHPGIGEKKALHIISTLNPIYGFNYAQLISKLTENNIPLKESATITGFVGSQLDGNTKKLPFELINWLGDYSGIYMPFENNPGLKENILKFFMNDNSKNKDECVKNISKIFEKFQIPVDNKTNLICEEWKKLFENYPDEDFINSYIEWINKNTYLEKKDINMDEFINLNIIRTDPIRVSESVSVKCKNASMISILPILHEKNLIDPMKEVLEGFKINSKTIIFDDNMDLSIEKLGLKDRDNLFLIIKNLEPENIDLNIVWKDINTRDEGNFTLSLKESSLKCLIQELYKQKDFENRTIKSLVFPSGKIIQAEINIENVPDLNIENSDTVILNTILKKVELLNLKLLWRKPSIVDIIPSLDDKEHFIIKNIQISSSETFENLLKEMKSNVIKATFKDKQDEIKNLEIVSIEIFKNNESIFLKSTNSVPNIISNFSPKLKTSIGYLNICNNDQILFYLNIEPTKTFNIIVKSPKMSYIARLTSIPYKYEKDQPYFGLYQILNSILNENLQFYNIIVPKKYFINQKDLPIKPTNINIANYIKTFNSVEKLIDGSIITLNNRNKSKKNQIDLLIILKDSNLSKTIKFENSMFVPRIIELIKKNFGENIIPETFFTVEGKEIYLSGNQKINFDDFSIKDNDILYLMCSKQLPNTIYSSEEKKQEISFARIEELLLSYGYRIRNNPENIEKFKDISEVKQFIENFFPHINVERLIFESQDHLYEQNYKFPTVSERLVSLLNENLITINLDGNLFQKLYEDYKLINEQQNDFFDFLNCIRAFRNLYFYYRPEKKIYTANVYNICNKIGHALFRMESWISEQGTKAVLIATLEDYLLNPINVEQVPFINFIEISNLIGSACINVLKGEINKLQIHSDQITNLKIPLDITEEQICTSIQAYLSEFDDINGDYTKFVELLPAYSLSEKIDKFFPIIWEEGGFGTLLPSIFEVKQAINPLFNFEKIFFFIQKHLEIYLEYILNDYPNCIIIVTISIIRNIMVNSKISPKMFLRKLTQFAIEQEYKVSNELNTNIEELIQSLSVNEIILSDEIKYTKGNFWVWDVIKNNKQPNKIIEKMSYSYKYLLLFDGSSNLCPSEEPLSSSVRLLDDDIQLLINYFTKEIKNAAENLDEEFSKIFLINDLILISSKTEDLKVDKFYKIIHNNIIEIIKRNDQQIKKLIGYSNVENYNREFVPFIVSFKVLYNILLNEIIEKDILKYFLRFFVYEIFFNLGIIVGNIEIQYISENIIKRFDWNKMSISLNYIERILIEICPINSATFIEIDDKEVINEIAQLFVDIFESEKEIKQENFRFINTNSNNYLNLTPRVNFFKYLAEKHTPTNENNKNEIGNVNEILIKKGYPKNLIKKFNEHLKNSVDIYNNEIIHVGRLGKIILTTRQQHIGSIFASYGYMNIQPSLLLSNFDHLHCFNSVIEIITDNPKRLDHYFQICMSICLEVNEINHFECEKLTIQTISTVLLSKEKSNTLNRLISFLNYDYIFEDDLEILREIYIDHETNRTNEKWVNLFISMKNYFNFYSIINHFKPYVNEIILNKGINEPSSGFGFLDLIGEFISLWTRSTISELIKNVLIKQGFPLNLSKYFFNLWPGDGNNRIKLRVSEPDNRKIKTLKYSLTKELINNGITEKKALLDVENILQKMFFSLNIQLGNNFNNIFNLKNKSYTSRMLQQGVNIDELYSKLNKKGAISIFLLLEECIDLSNKEIKDYLNLNYSDILSFCAAIINEISYQKISFLNNKGYNQLLSFKSKYSRTEIYEGVVFHALRMALNYIFEGFIIKIGLHEFLSIIKSNLYLLNNENGINIFSTEFVIKFKLPIDPNILSYYLKEILLNSVLGINLDKSEQIKMYQNVPDLIMSCKGFHKLVYEISRELLDPIKDEVEENHFKLLFKKKDIIDSINKGFNPISIKSFISQLTNNPDQNLVYKFAAKLGMSYLSFKLLYIYQLFQKEIDETLKNKNISKNEREFFNKINLNLNPLDQFIYELIDTSKENCILEVINKYSLKTQPIYFGPHFSFAEKICENLIGSIEKINQEIDQAFKTDTYFALNYCDKIRLSNKIQNIEFEINNALYNFNNPELMKMFFEFRTYKDLYLEKTFKYIENKINKASKRSKYFRIFNKWNRQVNKNVFNQIIIKKNIFDKILTYVDNHVFAIIPILRKISYSIKDDINIKNYQKIKKTLSKLLLSMGTVVNPYSVPSFIKNNYKIKSEYLNELGNFKRIKSEKFKRNIVILGINLSLYYSKICWYIHYLSIISQEINVLLNQLPHFSLNKMSSKNIETDFQFHKSKKDKPNIISKNKTKKSVKRYGKFKSKNFKYLKNYLKKHFNKK